MDVPLDITPYAPPGVAERFTPLEDGVFRRLLRYSWRQRPPCTLPDDAGFLAVVAGVTQQQWSECSTRLALTWTNADGRLLLSAARALYDAMTEQATQTRERKRRAAHARWDQNHPPPGADAMQVHSTCNAGASGAPSSEARAHAERSCAPCVPKDSSPILSAQSAPSGEVLARLGSARAQDIPALVRAWQTQESRRMLRRTIDAWAAEGLTTFPQSKADELASWPTTTPARVQTAVERIEFLRKLPAKDERRARKPVGLLLSFLGSGRRPRLIEIDLVIQARWDQFEAVAIRRLAAQAAIDAAAPARSAGGPVWAERLTKGAL